MPYMITFEPNPSPDNIQRLYDGLSEHAKLQKVFVLLSFMASLFVMNTIIF